MRLLILPIAAMLTACAPAPRPVEPQPRPDATKEDWYRPAIDQLASLNREAETLLARGNTGAAGEVITRSQPVLNRLLSAQQPTLEAMEAVSDSDQLYGRVLMANRHYGWARMAFQKNATRWKVWRPQTSETARRMKLATEAIAECDREMKE